MEGRRPESHAGVERKLHDQSRAEELLTAGLELLKLRRSELGTLPKGQREKQVLAWWLYGKTTVKRRWLAEQLAMGYETRVSRAANLVETTRDPAVLSMKKQPINYGI